MEAEVHNNRTDPQSFLGGFAVKSWLLFMQLLPLPRHRLHRKTFLPNPRLSRNRFLRSILRQHQAVSLFPRTAVIQVTTITPPSGRGSERQSTVSVTYTLTTLAYLTQSQAK